MATSAPRTVVPGRFPAARGAVGTHRRCDGFRADRCDAADRSLAPAGPRSCGGGQSRRRVWYRISNSRTDSRASFANSTSAPEQLILEVTEAASLYDPELVMDIFTRLRVKGVGLSLDDFGTGASSLTQLYKMPFSEVKIDGTLIREAATSKAAATVVRAIVELAHNLSLSACAERRRDLAHVRIPRSDRLRRASRASSSHPRCPPPRSRTSSTCGMGRISTLVPVVRK